LTREQVHPAGQIMKHVLATTTDNLQSQTNSAPDDVESAPTPTTISTPPSKGKQSFHDRTIDIFEKMPETNTCLMKNFERTNELLERVDHQFDHLINKL